MLNCGRTLLGIVIGVAATVSIKVAYEYGRYSAIHEICKRGWTIVISETEDEKTTKE